MVNIENTIVIDAPRNEVFSYFSPDLLRRWFGTGKVKISGEYEEFDTGYRYELMGFIYGKKEIWPLEVVGLKKNRSLSLRIFKNGSTAQLTFELKKVKGEKTRFNLTYSYLNRGIITRFTDKLFTRRKIRRLNQQFLEKLSRRIEKIYQK